MCQRAKHESDTLIPTQFIGPAQCRTYLPRTNANLFLHINQQPSSPESPCVSSPQPSRSVRTVVRNTREGEGAIAISSVSQGW